MDASFVRGRGNLKPMSANSSQTVCARCAGALPSDARFCPQCGAKAGRDKTIELPITGMGDPAPRVHHVERRPLGLAPTPLIGGLGLLALVVGIVLLASGPWATGVVLLVVGAALLLLFVVAARQEPDSPAARALALTAARVRDRTGFAVAASRTWSSASGEVARLGWRRRQLERELSDLMAPLGEAVHRNDEVRVQALRGRAAQLRRSLEDLDGRRAAVVKAAHHEVERERAPVQATRVLPAVPPPPGPSDTDGSGPPYAEPAPPVEPQSPGRLSA
jgi:ribosomal protein L40E